MANITPNVSGNLGVELVKLQITPNVTGIFGVEMKKLLITPKQKVGAIKCKKQVTIRSKWLLKENQY